MGRGRDAKVRIEGNVLIDPDGDRWIKKLEKPKRSMSVRSVAGKYVSEKNDNNYMVLKADRSFFIQERSQQMHGEYDIDGNIIILKMGRGRDAKVRIEGNVLIDPDGDRWIKKLEETERP